MVTSPSLDDATEIVKTVGVNHTNAGMSSLPHKDVSFETV